MVKKGTLSNGSKAALSTAAEDSLLETRSELPKDPVDVRLTVGGAIVDDKGKLNVAAYEDLHTWYAGEPSPDKHPNPKFPGVHRGEDVAKGLRVWDDVRAGAKDKDGAGWIASRSARKGEPKREKWFNMRTTGSWRLAFVLARLQQDVWHQRGGMGFNEQATAAAAASRELQGLAKLAKEDGEKEAEGKPATGEVLTPQKPAAATRKRKAQASPAVKQQPPQKKATIGAVELAGSTRLQAILAARDAQAAAAAAK